MSKFIKNREVKTITGKMAYAVDCRLVNGVNYVKGNRVVKDSGDVYFIEEAGEKGKWFREETGYLIYDYTQKKYMLKTDLKIIIENGIVGFNVNNTPIFGDFSKPTEEAHQVIVSYKGKAYIALNDVILENNKVFRECLQDGIWYDRRTIPAIKFIEPAAVSEDEKRRLPYDSKGQLRRASKVYEANYKPVIYPQIEAYYKVLGDTTFGLEFETVKGVVPQGICDNLGLVPVRDGSIAGLEFVTVPLKGKEGMQCIIDVTKQLTKRTRFSTSCALHIHVGNMPRTEGFFLALYKVLFRLQDEVFGLFPLHKHTNYGVKRKHYTKPLPMHLLFQLDGVINRSNIKKNFAKLFNYLSMGMDYENYGSELENVDQHPSDPDGERKWNIRTRYHWVNLIPLLFGNKQTVEFRIHTPTHDPDKVMHFLFMCTSIIQYVRDNVEEILKNPETLAHLTLQTVFDSQCNKHKLGRELSYEFSNYLHMRKTFINGKTRDGDLIADEDDFNYRHKRLTFKRPMDNIDIKKDGIYMEEPSTEFTDFKFKHMDVMWAKNPVNRVKKKMGIRGAQEVQMAERIRRDMELQEEMRQVRRKAKL